MRETEQTSLCVITFENISCLIIETDFSRKCLSDGYLNQIEN